MTNVCITGMHRSGTPMIAHALSRAGLFLGDPQDLHGPSDDNPDGYWEHKRIVAINDDLLELFGGGWDLPPQLAPGWLLEPRVHDMASRALTIFDQLRTHEHWGWKDPRCALTLPFWLSQCPDLFVVACVRNPLEVANSLRRRG